MYGQAKSTSCTVTGLTNGDSYSFTASATNISGTGEASHASNSVVPSAPPHPPGRQPLVPQYLAMPMRQSPGAHPHPTVKRRSRVSP